MSFTLNAYTEARGFFWYQQTRKAYISKLTEKMVFSSFSLFYFPFYRLKLCWPERRRQEIFLMTLLSSVEEVQRANSKPSRRRFETSAPASPMSKPATIRVSPASSSLPTASAVCSRTVCNQEESQWSRMSRAGLSLPPG